MSRLAELRAALSGLAFARRVFDDACEQGLDVEVQLQLLRVAADYAADAESTVAHVRRIPRGSCHADVFRPSVGQWLAYGQPGDVVPMLLDFSGTPTAHVRGPSIALAHPDSIPYSEDL